MAATDLPDLYQFEKHFEDAAAIFLATDVGITIYTSSDFDDFVTPRLEVEFLAGEAESPPDSPITSVPALAEGEFRKYTAELILRLITDPGAGQTRAEHFEYLGKTRVSLLQSKPNWDSTSLPYYDLKWIRQLSTDNMADGYYQRITLSYDIRFAIRDDAFPTS